MPSSLLGPSYPGFRSAAGTEAWRHALLIPDWTCKSLAPCLSKCRVLEPKLGGRPEGPGCANLGSAQIQFAPHLDASCEGCLALHGKHQTGLLVVVLHLKTTFQHKFCCRVHPGPLALHSLYFTKDWTRIPGLVLPDAEPAWTLRSIYRNSGA